MGTIEIPGHEGNPQGWYRKALQKAIPDPVFRHLPGRWQGAMCGCKICLPARNFPNARVNRTPERAAKPAPAKPARAGRVPAPPRAIQARTPRGRGSRLWDSSRRQATA